ncbi:MAG: dTTP/UTP pyrophosphatase [Chlamydiia bacterium]|nr:dTTP/UTP pyrophosphatase [Chlamydiia bacterium]MCH9618127.1 dTTP/UTP pyrophosphatase [Chlamydiia bacterium]MCH9624007.1 dTTP/UTP pyrophosphatase [Chlamydiia bacterium]
MIKTLNKSIILASSSPRRKEILSLFDFPFTIDGTGIDESKMDITLCPEEYTKNLAKLKGKALITKHQDCIIISADTIVYHQGKYLSKPKDLAEAASMLQSMSGKTHTVGTAIAVHDNGLCYAEYEETKVTMRDLTQDQIQSYISTFKPLDKAGGYGIQDGAGILIEKIEGNFHNVVGFEVKLLEKLFIKIGINLWHHLSNKTF